MVKRKAKLMLDEIDHLKEFKSTPVNEFIQSWREVRIVERSIQLIAQVILDIAGHIVANQGWKTPATYRELIMSLSLHGILEEELAYRLADLDSMRNILVHEYQEVNKVLLHEAISFIIVDGPEFVDRILTSLEGHEY